MTPSISDAELEVLKVLWAEGEATVRVVAAAMRRRRRRLAYNTILTLLSRLREKGYVAADTRETAHVFRPVVSREELLTRGLSTLANRVCDGMASPLVHALVKSRRLSSTDIAELRRLVDTLDEKE